MEFDSSLPERYDNNSSFGGYGYSSSRSPASSGQCSLAVFP